MGKISIWLIINIVVSIFVDDLYFIFMTNLILLIILENNLLIVIKESIIKQKGLKNILNILSNGIVFKGIGIEILFQASVGFNILASVIEDLKNGGITELGFLSLFLVFSVLLIVWAALNIKKFYVNSDLK